MKGQGSGGKSRSGGGSIAITSSKARLTQAINDKMISLRQAIFDSSGRDKDVLEQIAPAFLQYQRNGLDLAISLQFSLSKDDMKWYFDLIKENMEERYDDSGIGWDDSDKQMELNEKGKRFLVVREKPAESSENKCGAIVAIAHFRFSVQGETLDAMAGDTTLFLGDIHLVESVQRKGLGKHLLVVLELVARKENMSLLSIPVCLNDEITLNWLKKCKGYVPDPTLPLLGFNAEEEGYEVYAKRFGMPVASASNAASDPLSEMTSMLKLLSVKAKQAAAFDADAKVEAPVATTSVEQADDDDEEDVDSVDDELETSNEASFASDDNENADMTASYTASDESRIIEELKVMFREANGREAGEEELVQWLMTLREASAAEST